MPSTFIDKWLYEVDRRNLLKELVSSVATVSTSRGTFVKSDRKTVAIALGSLVARLVAGNWRSVRTRRNSTETQSQ